MQSVSLAYKASMKELLRNRGYIQVVFGLISMEAQANATLGSMSPTAPYSFSANILNGVMGREYQQYATLEENWTKVDASMYFLPKSGGYYNAGIVSRDLISKAKFDINLELNIKPLDIKGLSIDFGENYPVDFDFITQNGDVVEFRDNDMGQFVTEEVIPKASRITIRVYKMKNPESRLRIHAITFGYGMSFGNDYVIDSTLTSDVSPIGEYVPQIDFELTLKNYDKYFDVDNPKSAINYLETGQEVEVFYGYEVNDEIEWVRGGHLYCSEWESNDSTATIRCVDIFRNMETEYYKGVLSPIPVSYYDLAERVCKDAGIADYWIDPHLEDMYTVNPLPMAQHKQVLQIIANACRCTLSQDRYGRIYIRSNFIPEMDIDSNGEAPYSHLENVFNDDAKKEYASLNTNYTTVGGEMFFIDKGLRGGLYTGFVSEFLSDANGRFTTNPMIVLSQKVAFSLFGLKLIFGYCEPAEIVIRTYIDGDFINDWTFTDIEKETNIVQNFYDFDRMEIEFTRTKEPFNRVVVNNISVDVTSYEIERRDMISSPVAIKQELIKDIVVPYYSYQLSQEEETSVLSQEVEAVSGQTATFFISEAGYGYRAEFENISGGVTVIDSGAYYVTVRYSMTGTFRLQIFGYYYKITERRVVKELNHRGKTITWENPLMSSYQMADEMATWLGDYYNVPVEYEYDYRGNPELDVNDIIFQENNYLDEMLVRVYRSSLTFNGAFRGTLNTRRMEYVARA